MTDQIAKIAERLFTLILIHCRQGKGDGQLPHLTNGLHRDQLRRLTRFQQWFAMLWLLAGMVGHIGKAVSDHGFQLIQRLWRQNHEGHPVG